jgi:hypothetical protein
VHANDETKARTAVEQVQRAIAIGPAPVSGPPLIDEVVA